MLCRLTGLTCSHGTTPAPAACSVPVPGLLGPPQALRLESGTRLIVHKELQTFPPLELLQHPTHQLLNATTLDRYDEWQEAASIRWSGAARAGANRQLRVHVIGTSPTAGCGAAEDVNGGGPAHNRSVGLSRMCDTTRGWPRHMQDFLSRLLAERAPQVEVSFKSAAAANYFERCVSSRITPQTDVVLLEVLTNVFGSDLVSLLRHVQHAAPSAAVVFVMWPSATILNGGFRNPHADPNVNAMLAAARSEGADVLDFAELLRDLRRQGHGGFYAQANRDAVHPNPQTHQLLGAVAARFVARRLRDAECRSGNATAGGAGALSNGMRRQGWDWEVCYNSPGQMPVEKSSVGFSLVDEGGDKGVRKMGLVSHHVGDRLSLGPLVGPSWRNCSMLSMSVGYLLSTTRLHQGAFSVECTGCDCAPIHNPYQSELYPFPLVQTDARVASSPQYWHTNVSITASTEWWVLWTAASQCRVHITHRRSAAEDAALYNQSRIRIDSFHMLELAEGYRSYAGRRGRVIHRQWVNHVRNNCSTL
jgi:hypothetical protein